MKYFLSDSVCLSSLLSVRPSRVSRLHALTKLLYPVYSHLKRQEQTLFPGIGLDSWVQMSWIRGNSL